MIALAHPATDKSRNDESFRNRFVAMLPAIREQARVAFRGSALNERDELIAEVVANCYIAFVRLCERGREDIAYPTPLAMYAIKQIRSGRQVGTNLNIHDVTSTYCQRNKNVAVKRLDQFDCEQGAWLEVLVEDRRSNPAELAASRIDFGEWLRSLPGRLRQIAKVLASGESTSSTAKRFGVSRGRISQIRRELSSAWDVFHGELCLDSR